MSPKQIVLLTLLTKLWEKYLDVNVAIDVLEKQVSENAGAFFFFFHVSVPNGSSESQAFLSKTVETGKKNRIMTTFIVCK